MVENTGKKTGAGPIRPLNLPVPVTVEEDEYQGPAAVILGRRRLEVASVEDQWEVQEEWWRLRPIVRTYYRVALEDGRRTTVFRDRLDGTWSRQHDTHPPAL